MSTAPPPTEGVIALYTKEQRAIEKQILPVKPAHIPEELRARPQWVVWKAVGEKPDKVPYSARTGCKASSTDLMTWSTFEEALEAYKNGEYAGLGFVFSSADPYTGIDLDDCVDEDGEIASWALEIVRYFDSYTEFSVSGGGLHLIVRGKALNRRKGGIEVYSTERFFTVTGHVVEVARD
jgi:putative DNA primase/helicase